MRVRVLAVPVAFAVVVAAVGIVVTIGFTRVAAADEPAPPPGSPPSTASAEARRLLDEGTRLFTDEAAHEAARDAFTASYKLEPSWRALNGIALTYQEQGRYLDALQTYEQMTREFGPTLSEAQRSTADKRIAALEAKVGRLELTATQPRAHISIDSVDVGHAPLHQSIRLMPGRHVVVATLEGHQTLTKVVEIVAGGRVTLAVALEPERVIVRNVPVRLERRLPRWLPWATIGGGAVLAGTAGLLHLAAQSNFDEFDSTVRASSGSPPMPVAGDVSLRERGELETNLAIGTLIAGGVLALGGIVIFVADQPRPVEVTPTGIALRW